MAKFYFVLEFVKPPFNDRRSTEIAARLSFFVCHKLKLYNFYCRGVFRSVIFLSRQSKTRQSITWCMGFVHVVKDFAVAFLRIGVRRVRCDIVDTSGSRRWAFLNPIAGRHFHPVARFPSLQHRCTPTRHLHHQGLVPVMFRIIQTTLNTKQSQHSVK